jgi:hypothetical protein
MAFTLMASALLGVYADVGQYAPGFWGSLPGLGTPWVVLAFVGGRFTPGRVLGLLAGAGLMLLGLSTYAAWVHLAYGTSLYNITNDGRATSWACVAMVLGGASGLAGFSSSVGSQRQRLLAWGYLVGVPVAEAVHVLSTQAEPQAAALALGLLGLSVAFATLASRRVAWSDLVMSATGWAFAGYVASLVLY